MENIRLPEEMDRKLVSMVGECPYGAVYSSECVSTGRPAGDILVIRMPGREETVRQAREQGADRKALALYFDALKNELEWEAVNQKALRIPGVASFRSIAFSEEIRPAGWTAFLERDHVSDLRRQLLTGETPEETCRMGMELCEALRRLEREGIVCGDISPDTVCRTETGRYALTGLGLRRALQKAGSALYGTVCRDYDAPEVRDGAPATARSDVYSLALLMKEMMAGSGENECAAALQTVLDRALSPAPEDRYAGGQEMQQALQACLPSVPAAAEPERKKETKPAGTTPETKKKRTRLAVMAAVLAAAVLAVTVGALLLRPEKKPQEAPPAADLEEVGAYLQESQLPTAEGPATAESAPGAESTAAAPSLPPSSQPTPPASPEGTPEPAEPDGPAPEPEASGEPENVSACILPTDTERISYEDLAGMSDMETYMVINEIYARHGKIFTTESIQEYFEQQDWYTPETRDSQTVVSRFSDLEMANLSTVVQYQREMGYR